MPGACVKDVDQQEFVVAFAEFLKNSGKVKVPAWTDQVKTATHKELSPYNQDWWVELYTTGVIVDCCNSHLAHVQIVALSRSESVIHEFLEPCRAS